VKSKDLKYFYERLLRATGVSLKYFDGKNIIRKNRIKNIFNEN